VKKKGLIICHVKKKNVGLVAQEVNLADGQSDGPVKIGNQVRIVCLVMWSKKANCNCSASREAIVDVTLTKHGSCIKET
jgi:hypothetical protein